MKNEEKCHCGSDKSFENCCELFIKGTAKPLTAEALMRSRYSAYVIANIDYILKTTHPKTRKIHDVETIATWAKSSLWQKLEIVSTDKGKTKDSIGTVEFKAYFSDASSQSQIHHEVSNFVKELGKWFFLDGKIAD